MAEEQAAAPQEQAQQQFAMQRIYSKDLSFESPPHPRFSRSSGSPRSMSI